MDVGQLAEAALQGLWRPLQGLLQVGAVGGAGDLSAGGRPGEEGAASGLGGGVWGHRPLGGRRPLVAQQEARQGAQGGAIVELHELPGEGVELGRAAADDELGAAVTIAAGLQGAAVGVPPAGLLQEAPEGLAQAREGLTVYYAIVEPHLANIMNCIADRFSGKERR